MNKFLILLLSAFLLSCGSDDDSNATTVSYNGPGSFWSMTKTGTNYTISVLEDNGDTITVNATSQTLSNGFIKLTVASASATGSATAPTVGEIAHGVEVPGVAFLLKPMDPTGETIPMVAAGSCPTSNFDANWIIGGRDYFSGEVIDGALDWYGDISWNTSTGEATFSNQFGVEGATPIASGLPRTDTVGICSGGLVQTATLRAYFTQAGVAIVHTNIGASDESQIIGVPQGTISDITTSYGDYVGFYFEGLATEATYAASMTLEADGGGGDHHMLINTLSGSDLSSSAPFGEVDILAAGVNSPANGFVSGKFLNCIQQVPGNGDCEVACAGAGNVNGSGKTMIYCVGQHPADEDRRVTLLFVSK